MIYLKFKQRGQSLGYFVIWCNWNSKQCRPWSDCSSRSSLIRACTVCPDLSVLKLRVITVESWNFGSRNQRVYAINEVVKTQLQTSCWSGPLFFAITLKFWTRLIFQNASISIWAAPWENLSLGCRTRSNTNQAVQPQKTARGLISDLGSRGIVLSMYWKQRLWSAVQLLHSWSAPLF